MKKTVESKKPAKSESHSTIAELEVPKKLNQNAASVIESLNEATRKKNKEFKEMSKMEKRVSIAKDVIASLKSKKYIAEAGIYVNLVNGKNEDEDIAITLSNMMKKDVKCEVCAIGSLFLSNLKKSKTRIGADDDDDMCASLSDVYTEEELRILEYCFEGDDISSSFNTDSYRNMRRDACDFYSENSGFGSDDDARLNAIMKNIIKHEGRFIHKSIKV